MRVEVTVIVMTKNDITLNSQVRVVLIEREIHVWLHAPMAQTTDMALFALHNQFEIVG